MSISKIKTVVGSTEQTYDIHDSRVDSLSSAMVFKGTLGTGGTITSLPTASSNNTGFTYKVITAATYASQAAKVGDVFVSDGSSWILIPSGDEPSGTVTSVTIKGTSPIVSSSSSAITTSGTRTISHATSGVTAGSYGDSGNQTPTYGGTFNVPYVTVDSYGHVTGISSHTVKIPASDNTNTTYKLTINGTDNGGGSTSLGSIYAPTSYGTSGYYLKANGANTAPEWAAFPTIPSKMSDVATISVVAVTADTSSSCSITGSGNAGKSQTIIYTNSSGSDKTVTVPTTYKTPDGAAIELTCPNGGYCEVNYLNISGTIYARGI